MTKKITTILLVLVISILSCTPAFAAEKPYFVDDAALVIDGTAVENALKAVSDKHNLDVVVVTTYSTDGLSNMAYADDYFDYNGYGRGENRDGLLMLINMSTSEAWISTSGYGITAFTDAGIEYIGKQVSALLGDSQYEQAFIKFAELCDDFIATAKAGTPYDVDTLPKDPFNFTKSALIALGIGLVAALIFTGKMKGELKTVRKQAAAANYERPGSLNIVAANEYFLYSHVDRVKRESSSSGGGSSTHTSSSGRTHGGGGFKF